MKISEIIKVLNSFAPRDLQESYDNSGLSIGDPNHEATGALCTIDITHDVVDEAIEKDVNLIVSHHPLIFQGLKSITGKNYIEEIIIRAIKNDIAIYSGHTNFDNISTGVNHKICNVIGLQNCQILKPLEDNLIKLVTFVPEAHATKVRNAIFESGAGKIGNYDCCSYNLNGEGSFRGNDNTNPFIGEKGKVHFEHEIRIETILPGYLKAKVLKALILSHPYEEVAYDFYPLANPNPLVGAGMIGNLPKPLDLEELLLSLKEKFSADGIRYAGNKKHKISRIAVCGGSGSFLIKDAIIQAADVFITGDIKYHQFFDADNNLTIIDIGHFESEQFTKDIFYELLTKKIPNFAVHLSEVKTNPVNYYK
jgi:dinuclear metal center YbgI/SA1388 family protein